MTTTLRLPAGLVAGLALLLTLGALLALAPRSAEAQGLPPGTFYGFVSGLTVDGEPYDGTTAIEAVTVEGDLIAQATVEGDLWAVDVPFVGGRSQIRIRIGTAVSDPLAFESGVAVEYPTLVLTTPDELAEKTWELSSGFQTVAYAGEGEIAAAELLELFANPDAVEAIFMWQFETWVPYRPGLPAAIQGFTVVQQNAPLLVRLNAATTFTTELGAHQAGQWGIINGRTAMAYLGQDGTSLVDALATEVTASTNSSAVEALFRYNNATQNWDTYRAALPIGFASLRTLNRFDFIFIDGNTASSWSYEASE